MGIKSFLTKIWAAIEALFEKMPAQLQNAAHIAVIITEKIKTITDLPEVDILTAIIPGTIDDSIIAVLRERLPVILTELKLVDTQTGLSNPAAIVTAAINVIQNLLGDIKSAFLHDLSILIMQEITKTEEGKLSWSDAVYIVEWYYQHKFEKNQS